MRFLTAREWRVVGCAIAIYGLTTLIVVIGAVSLGSPILQQRRSNTNDEVSVAQRCFIAGDGYHFVDIATDGYTYDKSKRSRVAFFPVFPLTAKTIAAVSGLSIEKALALTANAYLLAAFALLAIYTFKRYGNASEVTSYALLAFGLFPTTFFLRMSYSESSFLFFGILSMLAIERRWPTVLSALIVGAATATRPVGIALVPVFCISIWQRSATRREFAFRSVLLLPLALWGLIAYMIYQYEAFDQPLAFAMSQEHWSFRQPVSFDEKVLAFLSHEPIWSVYDSSSDGHWQYTQPEPRAWSNLALANPVYFLLAIGLVVLGGWKKWLNTHETVLAALLILIPYLTRGFEMCMLSQGRFAAAVFPIYLVIGQLLSRCAAPWAVLLLGFSAVVMAIYAAQFAAGYMLI